MVRINRFAAALSLGAALSMAAVPAAAADLPIASQPGSDYAAMGAFDKDAENAERHRRWRHRGWYPRHRHRHRGIDAGDVIAGALIIGGIAAVANAAKRDRDYRYRDYRYRDYRDRDYRYRERRGDRRYDEGRGIDRAVSLCVERIERDVRVDTVDSVDRTSVGWVVTGSLYDGESFTCRLGADGRIDGIDYGGFSSSSSAGDAGEQWTEDRYRSAAARTQRAGPTVYGDDAIAADGPRPAYPGGPIDQDRVDAQGDDRYRTAEAPDFGN